MSKFAQETVFLQPLTVGGFLTSLISLGIIDENAPPELSVCFHDHKILTENGFNRNLIANYSISFHAGDLCGSNLKVMFANNSSTEKFFDTGCTFSEILAMKAGCIDVHFAKYPFWSTGVQMCTIIIQIPGLAQIVEDYRQKTLLEE